MLPQLRHELALGETVGGPNENWAGSATLNVDRPEPCLEPLVDRTRTDEDDVPVAGQAVRDLVDELVEVLQAARLTGVLRCPTAAVAGRRVVTNVPG